MDNLFDNKKDQQVVQCLYCGNKTLMDKVGEHKYSWDEDNNYWGYFLYQMYACPVCGRVTFYQKYWDSAQTDYQGNDYVDEDILYPINTLNTNALPPFIKGAFEAALKAKNISNDVCVLALRQTLELILIDKGATKWGLQDKIEELAQKNILPDTLKEASLIAKMFGDSAAHAKGMNTTIHDVNRLCDFIEYLLDYFYILPDKINAFKVQLDRAKERGQNGQ